jgi:Na+/H+-dicarboxylate symporter
LIAAFWIVTLVVFALLFAGQRRLGLPLWCTVLLALAAGIVSGLAFGEAATGARPIGDLFARLIQMLVLPLIFTTVAGGIAAIGDPRRLAGLGGRALALILGTSVAAAATGLLAGLLVRPGAGAALGDATAEADEPVTSGLGGGPLVDRLLAIVPDNPVAAFASGDVMAAIFFSVLFGIGIAFVGAKARAVADFIESAMAVMIRIALIVMQAAPYGVYALMAWVVGTNGLAVFGNLLVLLCTLYAACIVFVLIFYGALLRFAAGMGLRRFLKGIGSAQAVAFSTSSSLATLPVTIAAAVANLGVPQPIAGSVIPLAAAIHKNGTALYVALVTIFAAQASAIPLDATDYAVIVLATALVSLGGTGVPSSAFVLATVVLGAIGATADEIVFVIALILPVDRLFDMMRTTVNVTGHALVATLVAGAEASEEPVPCSVSSSS